MDLVIICEQPKIAPHVHAHENRHYQNLLKIEEGDISIKATTAEGMGVIGRRQWNSSLCNRIINRSKMNILLTNDDGYKASGIQELYRSLGS